MFLGVAAVVWWYAHNDGHFFVAGLEGTASELLGPLLPALSAGLIAALAFSLADAAAGGWAAALAALVVIALPGFLPLHGHSLEGPPTTASILLTVAVMLYAPRFSLAYGALAAVTAVFMSTAALGLPIAAVSWAWLQRQSGNGRARRAVLAVVPLLLAVLIGRFTGDELSG
ncbi:MAG TPA: hypothetical protein PLL69_11815, partial [Gemmatimonadales bacterium]|nr:hypothetical protein [Gemmatimonadales bacterium]